MRTVTIADRFRGPPDSANGGYACGVVAAALETSEPVQVTLRSPPPLDTPLSIVEVEGGVQMKHGETVVAEGRTSTLDLEVPAAVDRATAEVARKNFVGFENHFLPTCFVCGTKHEQDGLRIFPGRVEGRELAAAPWDPTPDLYEGGRVAPVFMWSALDCPSCFGAFITEPVLLGRLVAQIDERPPQGEELVAVGWPIERDGRKIFAGSAIFGEDGRVLAKAFATWIAFKR